jgi:hypothetical protein
VGDWRGFGALCCELTVDGPPVHLSVVLRTGRSGREASRRCFSSDLGAGRHSLSIDLAPDEDPRRRPDFDLSQMHSVYFNWSHSVPATVELHRLYLSADAVAIAAPLFARYNRQVSANAQDGAVPQRQIPNELR